MLSDLLFSAKADKLKKKQRTSLFIISAYSNKSHREKRSFRGKEVIFWNKIYAYTYIHIMQSYLQLFNLGYFYTHKYSMIMHIRLHVGFGSVMDDTCGRLNRLFNFCFRHEMAPMLAYFAKKCFHYFLLSLIHMFCNHKTFYWYFFHPSK